MRHLTPARWVAIGGFIGALGAFIASVPDWHAFTSTTTVGALLAMISSFLIALFSNKRNP